MDALLKELADASMALAVAEEALDEGAYTSARDQLDDAAGRLAALRERWPELSGAERTLVGRTAAPLRARLDAARARLPKAAALTDVAPTPADPEEDEEPDAS